MFRAANLLSALVCIMLSSTASLTAEEPPANVLVKDSFETGKDAPDDWKQGAAVPGVKYVYDRAVGSEGKRSLSLQKSEKRYFPIAEWSRTFPCNSAKPALKLAVKVKASRATKAVVDVQFLDAKDDMIKHEWIAYIGQKEPRDPVATHGWKSYGGSHGNPQGHETDRHCVPDLRARFSVVRRIRGTLRRFCRQ